MPTVNMHFERPLCHVNLSIELLIATPDDKSSFLEGHISHSNELTSQKRIPLYSIIILSGTYTTLLCGNSTTNNSTKSKISFFLPFPWVKKSLVLEPRTS